MRERLVMTKEDVKEFLSRNQDRLELIGTCVFCAIASIITVRCSYAAGYRRGNYDTSIAVQRTIGNEKYDQLLVAMTKMFEGK